MRINWQLKRLNLKIVYYGPALSGKTTNLEVIHRSVNPKQRSDLVSLKTREDRTLYFDFLQLELGKIAGLTPQIQLYTVPGQSYYEASRKIVLRGADGVVFVADSDRKQMRANLLAWRNMRQHLNTFGVDPDNFPLAAQFNKRDLPTAVPPRVIAQLLQLNGGTPAFEATAIQGKGVLPTLKAITKAVIAQVQREMVPA